MRKEERIFSDRVKEFEDTQRKDNKRGYANYKSLPQGKGGNIWPGKQSQPTGKMVLVVKGMG